MSCYLIQLPNSLSHQGPLLLKKFFYYHIIYSLWRGCFSSIYCIRTQWYSNLKRQVKSDGQKHLSTLFILLLLNCPIRTNYEKKMMVINSTNISKTNNHLSSHLNWTHRIHKWPLSTYDVDLELIQYSELHQWCNG